jgi:hypothetical protein
MASEAGDKPLKDFQPEVGLNPQNEERKSTEFSKAPNHRDEKKLSITVHSSVTSVSLNIFHMMRTRLS